MTASRRGFDSRCRDDMTPTEASIIFAAIAWWKNHRPCSFSEAEHLAEPAINTANDVEKRLARAVAKLVMERKR